MSKIDEYAAQTGRRLKEDSTVINIADMVAAIYDPATGTIKIQLSQAMAENVTITNATLNSTADVTDRAGRLLGAVSITGTPAVTLAAIPALVAGTAAIGKVGVQVSGNDVSQAAPLPTSQASALAIAGKTVVTTAGTPVALGSQACNGVFVIANPLNVGAMYIFPAAGVKTSVIPLQSGDSDFWPVTNISALKVDSAVSGESVFWKGAV